MPDNDNIRKLFVGLDVEVDYDGGTKVAVNLDSAATTPPLVSVVKEIEKQMLMYGSIGRGTGQKSKYSSELYQKGRAAILDFVGADKDKYEVIYVGSTTDGMNKLASALLGNHRELVLTTRMEHHANDLPWRERARTVYVDVDEKGRLNIDEIERLLEKYNRYTDYNKQVVVRDTIKYVSVTAASNVTGYINDVHKIAKIAHEYGAKIVVDGAQIVAHRAFSMKGNSPDEDIDFFVFSAHKMYSPFGGGVIVGLKEVLNARLPVFYGGGMVDMVADDDVVYSKAPDRYEAGSPNYPGVVGMLEAIRILKEEVGFDAIKSHEEDLLKYAIEGLKALNERDAAGESNAIKEVLLYGDCVCYSDRVGILVFNLTRYQNDYVADYVARHAAIAVRHAKFCAHTYVNRLLTTVTPFSSETACIHGGMVRVSFGLYNTREDVDALIAAIRDLLESDLTSCDIMDRVSIVAGEAIALPNDRG